MSQLFNIYVLNMSHTFHSQVLQATRAVLRTPAAAGRLAQTPAVLPRRGGRAAVDQGTQATCRFPRLRQEPHWSPEPAEETSGRQIYHFSNIYITQLLITLSLSHPYTFSRQSFLLPLLPSSLSNLKFRRPCRKRYPAMK